VLGYAEADNAEINPGCDMPLIAGLQCKLVEKSDLIRITPGSRLSSYCGPDVVEEKYNCGFGINPEYLSLFDGSELRFSGWIRLGNRERLKSKIILFSSVSPSNQNAQP
jgi:CTP synthase (UTP-ammonia lyase)